jgi:hypothetical protein
MSEELFTCPRCGRGKFTKRGLAAHVCKAAGGADGAKPQRAGLLPATNGPAPVPHEPAGEAAQWAAVRRYVEGARLFQRASLAAQIMAGMGLLDLRKDYGEKRGGDRKSFAAKNQKPHGAVFDFSDWPAVVKRELGISDDTARRWMEMATEARKRLNKGDMELGRILEKHPGALTPAEQELLKTAVHKISDGKTQMEFLLECGVAYAGSAGAHRAGEAGAAATKGKARAPIQHARNVRNAVTSLVVSLPHVGEGEQAEAYEDFRGDIEAKWRVAMELLPARLLQISARVLRARRARGECAE